MWCSESFIIQPQGKPLPLGVELDQAVQKHVAAQSAYTIFVSYKYKLPFNLPTPVPTYLPMFLAIQYLLLKCYG